MGRIFGTLLIILVLNIPAMGQFTTVDWGFHNVGAVTEMVNNRGNLHDIALPSFPFLIKAEFPRGSFVEHHDAIAPFYASLSKDKQDTMVTTSRIWAWNSALELNGYSSAPWDSVWEVTRASADTVNIPWLDDYQIKSDQDMVTRYNDYNQASLQPAEHDPQFIDIYQRSWAWSSQPLDQFIIFDMRLVPTRRTLYDFWTGIFFNSAVGYAEGTSEWTDDRLSYYPEHRMIVAEDEPGNEGPEAYTPMGIKVLPPREYKGDLDWTFQWGYSGDLRVARDKERYEQLTLGEIQSDQELSGNATSLISWGPIDSLAHNDTLHWRFATVYGYSVEELLEKSALIDTLAPDFDVPSPPPSPQVDVTTSNRQVVLEWDDSAEDYTDPNRSDGIDKPFEGYRVYKSTNSRTGPWTLLAEYDLAGNEFGQNTGLERKFTDTGLMNNVEYYYAVTAFSKPDTVLGFPSQSTSQIATSIEVVPGTAAPDDVGQVAVVPNPYRGDIDYNDMSPPWERPDPSRNRWLEQDRRIQFINLPERSTIKIYTLSGRLVETLDHEDSERGFEDWNLTSNVNQAVASGIYLFTVKNEESGNTQTGKFVIIK